jgi:hypothetical protein
MTIKNVIVTGLVAAKGAGKDTLAGFMADFGYQRMAFADALYAEAAEAYGTTVAALQVRETKETPQASLAPGRCNVAAFAEFCKNWLLEKGRPAQDDEPLSPREILQLWGTWRRDTISHRYWLDQVARQINALPLGSKVVITDVRYGNEADFIVNEGGVLVRILNIQAEKAAMSDTHPSETELRSRACGLVVDNNGNLAALQAEAARLDEQVAAVMGALQAA